jgi:hypothetical protein
MSESNNKDFVSYACNTLPHFWRSIYLMVTGGMAVTFALIWLGMPPIAITPFYFFTLVGLIFVLLKKSRFELTDTGITETLMPYLEIVPGKPKVKQFSWSQIKTYLLDENWNRSWGMQKYLKINFPGYQMAIWEGKTETEKQAFQKLSDYFLTQVSMERRKKSFYDKPLAKVLALFFAGMTLFFVFLAYLGILSPTSLIRLAVVLIPGSILFLNRVFRKPAK